MNNLLLHEILHGFVSLPFVYIMYRKTKSYTYSLIPFVTTYLIDLDHWIDDFAYHGLNLNIDLFFKGEYFARTNRAFVLFHVWEWLLMLILLAYQSKKWKSIKVGLILGIAPHLILDSINVGNILFYSIVYRLINGYLF